MVNVIGPTVWAIDTTISASSVAASNDTAKVLVQALSWDATSATASVTVFDGATNQVWSATSTANEQNISVEFPKGLNIDGIGFDIGAGTLYVYH